MTGAFYKHMKLTNGSGDRIVMRRKIPCDQVVSLADMFVVLDLLMYL